MKPGEKYGRCVNEPWVRLLDILGMNRSYRTCLGSRLEREDGAWVTDFLSGYGVYNTGHNHPGIARALVEELARNGPTMLQSHVPELAGELAERLLIRAGGGLRKVFFTSSGSEGVETAIKFARCRTGRPGILSCEGAFHGLTMGALSLMGNEWWKKGFGPFLPDTETIPFLDLDRLESRLRTERFAVFLVEPIQGEAGVQIPTPEALRGAETLCRKYGTLFVLDEVQTGLHRTGPFLAAHYFGVAPDMVILAKALSGGFVPVGAVLMTDEIHRAVYHPIERAFIHASTFGENALAMRAGLATLDVLEKERLGDRAIRLGETLRSGLRRIAAKHEMIEAIRGVGLMNGVKFRPPRALPNRLLHAAYEKAHAGLFGQMVVMKLYREGKVLTQMGGNDYTTVKACPPLVSTEEDMNRFIDGLDRVMDSFDGGFGYAEGFLIARRALAG